MAVKWQGRGGGAHLELLHEGVVQVCREFEHACSARLSHERGTGLTSHARNNAHSIPRFAQELAVCGGGVSQGVGGIDDRLALQVRNAGGFDGLSRN